VKAQPSIARRIVIGVAAAGAALLTASCAAGQHAASAKESPSIDGANAQVGSMLLRTVAITTPSGKCYLPGGDAALSLVLVNNSQAADSLTSVSSPRFSSYTVAKTADDLDPASGSGDCGAAASGSAAATSAPATGGSSASAPAAAPQTVAAGKSLHLGLKNTGTTDPGVPTAPIVVLDGLTGGPLHPGESVPVTFSFATAGKITLQVPVQLSAAPNNSVIPSVPNATETPIE
jgi:copper(I)-binding protein